MRTKRVRPLLGGDGLVRLSIIEVLRLRDKERRDVRGGLDRTRLRLAWTEWMSWCHAALSDFSLRRFGAHSFAR
jgi:hypothetical protein